jgi:hypothetical protein
MMAQNQMAIQKDRQDAYQEKLSFLNQRYNQMQGLASQGLGIAGAQAAKMETNPLAGVGKKISGLLKKKPAATTVEDI